MSAPSHDELLKQLLASPRLTAADKMTITKDQGVYVWWLVDPPATCLKVGRAYLGVNKNGLRRRMLQHFSSHNENTVLARHLAADKTSPWREGFNFTDRADRQRFLAMNAAVQTIALPWMTEDEVDAFEDFVEETLKPRYIDYVRA